MAKLSNKENAIVKLALEYWLDGQSLDSSLAASERKYNESLKRKGKMSEQSATKTADALKSITKQTNNKIERENRKHNKKTETDTKKSDKKIVATKEKSFKAWLKKRLSLLKRTHKKEEAAEKKSGARSKTFVGGFKNFQGKIGTIASYGAAIAILNAVRQAFTYVITKMIEFEVAFTDLAVKSGFTNREMAKVTDTIYEVAAATKFSTPEIISAATALGKLGFEAQAVVDILPNVANVAGATGESLENTAKIFGKVMNAYSLAATEAQYIADLMVDTFNNSALDLEKFNTAFSYVGAAAASTGTSLTELSKAMAILADRGVTASKIGTGLRNIFTKLGTEGDTLRGIIGRVNEEQLSFYEIAELVGRRAANQLFILMDSVEEFDEAIADSAENFGTAWEANAKQMNTFSAKWDIFINNITNKVAGLEFDPDETFRASLKESIDYMTRLNALKLFNSEGADIAVFNQVTANKEFLQELSAARKEIDDSGLNNEEIEKRLRDRFIKSVVDTIPPELQEIVDKRLANRLTNFTALSIQNQEIVKQKENEIRGLKKLFNLSDGDSILEAIERFDEGLEKNKLSARKELYQANLTEITSFVSQFNTDLVNTFNDAIKSGDDTASTQVLQTLIDEGLADESRMKVLLNVQKNSDLLTEEMIKRIRNKRDGTALQKALDTGNAFSLLSGNLSGGSGSIADVQRDDKKRFEKAVADRKAWESEMCSKAQDDSAYNWVLRQANITCPDKGAKKRGDFGKFKLNEIEKQKYRVEKDSLTKQFANEDDPLVKAAINNNLLKLEDDYQRKTEKQFNEYLTRMGSAREEFARKYPKQLDAFDTNIGTVQGQQVKTNADRDVNRNTYNNRDLELKLDGYKQDLLARQEYLLAIAKLDNKYQDPATNNAAKRKKILEDRNELTRTYFKKAEVDLKSHYVIMGQEIRAAEEINSGNIILGGAEVSLEKAKELYKQLQFLILKLQTEGEKAIKEPTDGDDFTDFDYFGAALEMTTNIYDVYKTFGDNKLRELEEQTARELEVIQARFDGEETIRNSALESGIISQEEAIRAEERARKKKIDNENKANKKLFEAQKKREKQDAIFTGLSSTAQAIALAFATNVPVVAVVMAAISAAAIATSTAMNVKAISRKKFVPQKYAEGGMVYGDSHAQGGIPFSVNGSSGYEMEGGEFIVNKEATKKHLSELERINGKTRRSSTKFADGGVVTEQFDGIAMLTAITEALSQPVRAYVTDQDLASSQSEREALTKKTSY